MQVTSGAPTVANPQAAIVESQNAQRIARRRSAATLAASIAQTGRAQLGRGPRRQVGGTFETIQDVPEATRQVSQQSLSQTDIERFLSAFRFDPTQQVLSEARSGQTVPRSLLAPGAIGAITSTPGTSTSSSASLFGGSGQGLFGGTIISPF